MALPSAGVEPATNPVAAIAVLRRNRKLGLRPTTYLVAHVANHHS